MTNRKERESDGGMSLHNHPPHQILYHAVVFVLAGTIIGVEEGVLLYKAMMVKKVVQPTDHNICTLATISCFIRQEVNLPGECLPADTKHSALPGCQKVDEARLRWIVHLLSIFKGRGTLMSWVFEGVHEYGGVNTPLVMKYARTLSLHSSHTALYYALSIFTIRRCSSASLMADFFSASKPLAMRTIAALFC